MSKNSWRNPLLLVVKTIISFAAVMMVLEGSSIFLLTHPRALQAAPMLQPPMRQMYYWLDRYMVQVQPNCMIYDADLAYRLKPGSCRFKNREFNTVIRANSAGLRDDETSLEAPEIIVLGDSFAMGWGVEQEETFAQIIEHRTGKRVLNAGISSYGTVREFKLLNLLDLSNLQYVVLEYNSSDVVENEAFQKNGNQLKIQSREEYERLSQAHMQMHDYWLGKYAVFFLRAVKRNLRTQAFFGSIYEHPGLVWLKRTPQDKGRREAELFLNAVEHSFRRRNEIREVSFIFFELEAEGKNDRKFTNALKTLIEKNKNPNFFGKFRFVFTDTLFSPQKHYYILDDHLNAAGHQQMAEAIVRVIDRLEGDSGANFA